MTNPSSDTVAVSAEADEVDKVDESNEANEADEADEATDLESVSVDAEPEAEERTTEPLPLDQVFGILKNQRRRYVLEFLNEADEEVTLSEVAEQVSAWENDKDISQISSKERKRVYVGLYQCHLPKMDAMGIVSFNKPRGVIELGEDTEEVYKYLEMSEEPDEPPWYVYSVALSVSGALVLAGALLLRSLTTVPVVDVAVVLLISVFLVYALAHIAWVRRHRTDDEITGGS